MTTITATWRPAKPGETPGQMTPECTNPQSCADPQCVHEAHLPDREDPWTAADEEVDDA